MKRWDPATAGYDMGFRDYSPGLNRFLTRDMYSGALADMRLGSDPWTVNRYAFAGGNPLTGVESDGHCPVDACGVGTPLGGGRVADFGPVDPGNDSAGYVRDGTEYDGAKPQGEYRQPVGARVVVAPNTKTYTNALIAAQQQLSARGDFSAVATAKFSGCTSMDTVYDAQGNGCGGAGVMHATELAALMCQQPGMTCGDSPGTVGPILAMGAAGGMMAGGKDGGRAFGSGKPPHSAQVLVIRGGR